MKSHKELVLDLLLKRKKEWQEMLNEVLKDREQATGSYRDVLDDTIMRVRARISELNYLGEKLS